MTFSCEDPFGQLAPANWVPKSVTGTYTSCSKRSQLCIFSQDQEFLWLYGRPAGTAQGPAALAALGTRRGTPRLAGGSCPGCPSCLWRRGGRSAGCGRVWGRWRSPGHVACRDRQACRGVSVRAAQPDPWRRSCLRSPAGPPAATLRHPRLWAQID